ncbi:DUF447 family protein [Methanolobus zinderi]|jgi:hypothetical protein|uniref:DUF447 family protein n=1 Tax=Methanolobus zinderi TaxID=536044 RepID=A0A7D5IN80_9EURY|nr:DUF447 domain-containing protein [Methanolobus zinderi]KXS45030.1 MAG: hypothetical protein AWU59_104 [Methanolobus sp. T82-4]QLC49445.1 DUF447 family protein [Methanolobus zinderi]
MLDKDFDIDSFGLYEGISETIVTTNKGWTPNAAPMGIIRKKDKLFIRLFKGSNTYENVLAEKKLVANITNDPILFALSTFTELDDSEFESKTFNNITISTLKEAQCWVAFECVNSKLTSEAFISELVPIYAHINKCKIRAPNRGLYGVIEACIHATRYQLTEDDKYLKLIKAYGDIVEKCGGEAEKEAMKLIYEYL